MHYWDFVLTHFFLETAVVSYIRSINISKANYPVTTDIDSEVVYWHTLGW
jgi:hypothetical protein